MIVGPTGAGKTSLSLDLAERVGAEIVSADSQQVYIGMDIGTGKVTADEQARVPHHLIDILRPDETMTAARFAARADAAIADIAGRGKPVVVVGGTMLYVRALVLGLFEGPPADPELRARLSAEAAAAGSPRVLWERLETIDPDSAARIDPNDLIRITRAIEVFEATGVPLTEHHKKHDHKTAEPRYPVRFVGLSPERDALYARIDARVDEMIAAGWVDEVAALRAQGFDHRLKSQTAIGYTELHHHLEGSLSLDDAVPLIKRNSRRYARRQVSWYRNDPRVLWSASASEIDLDELGRYLVPPDQSPTEQ